MPDSLNVIVDTLAATCTDTLSCVTATPDVTSVALESIPIVPTILHSHWLLTIVLLLFLLYCILVRSERDYLWPDLQGILVNDSRLVMRSVQQERIIPPFLLSIYGLLCAGFILYFVISPGIHLPDISWSRLLLSILFIVSFVSIQGIVTILFGSAFGAIEAAQKYLSQMMLLLAVMGVLLTPILLLMLYSTPWVTNILFWVAIVIIALIEILLIVKLFQNFMAKGLSIFYILLYLCTFKILLVLVCCKIVLTKVLIV